MSEEEWAAEMVGQRRITAQFANIDPCEVSGMRSPFLQGGGDPMYAMLQHNNFSYDCTWPSRAYGFTDAENGLYPYTLDYKSKQDCEILPCPSCSHPGLWVQPMLDLEDEWLGVNPSDPNLGNPCSMLDACTIIPHDQYGEQDPEQVYHMLMKNFLRVYEGDTDEFGEFSEGNRAPWGLYMHAAWFFGQDWHFQGYKKFIQEIASYNDTWIVPVSAGIAYMQVSPYMQGSPTYMHADINTCAYCIHAGELLRLLLLQQRPARPGQGRRPLPVQGHRGADRQVRQGRAQVWRTALLQVGSTQNYEI